MTVNVVDASFASALIIPSQRTEAATELATKLGTVKLLAPYVFSLETPWLLLKYERRVRDPGFTVMALGNLARLGIQLADAPDEEARDQALTLALERNMGFYDAMYLLLAAQADAPLVTRDAHMIAVAGEIGVSVLDVR